MPPKLIVYILPFLLALGLITVPFANMAELMAGLQSDKTFYLAFYNPQITINELYLGNKASALNANLVQTDIPIGNIETTLFYPMYLLAKLHDETRQAGQAVAMVKRYWRKKLRLNRLLFRKFRRRWKGLLKNKIMPKIYLILKERAGSPTSQLQTLPARHLSWKMKVR